MSETVANESKLDEVLQNMKDSYEEKIVNPKEKPLEYIRSQQLIKKLHTYIVEEFIEQGIDKSRVKEEVKLYGGIKYKDQDICIMPEQKDNEEIEITWGEEKNLGKKCESDDITEKIISINVRSQLSSLMKNKDTLLERTFAEALNFHIRCPKMCLGEVYLIPVYEYDNKKFKDDTVEFIKPLKYTLKHFSSLEEKKLIELDEINDCKVLKNRDCFIEKLNDFNIMKDICNLYEEEKEILKKHNVKIFRPRKDQDDKREKDYNRYIEIKSEIETKVKDVKSDITKVISIRSRLERYINFFDEINNRSDINKDYHKYERCTLLIVDFSRDNPKVYSSIEELKEDGLVAHDFGGDMSHLNIENFAKDLNDIYNKRFNTEIN